MLGEEEDEEECESCWLSLENKTLEKKKSTCVRTKSFVVMNRKEFTQ